MHPLFLGLALLVHSAFAVVDIYAIPVGQGDSQLIVCPNGHKVLVDLGSSGEAHTSQIYSFIRSQQPIQTIVITHPHTDHFNLVNAEVLSSAKEVIVGGNLDDYPESFLKLVKSVKVRTFPENYWGEKLSWSINCGSSDVKFPVFAANHRSGGPNEMSVVFQLQYGSMSALFTGDFEGLDKTLVAKYCPSASNCPLRSSFLKVSHHGAVTKANTQTLINAIAPKVAWVSSAYPPGRYLHPRCEVYDRLSGHLLETAPKHVAPCTYSDGTIATPSVNTWWYPTSVTKNGDMVTQQLLHFKLGTSSLLGFEITEWKTPHLASNGTMTAFVS